ncbi:MAG: hypothetical protein Q8R06_16265 [Polaromonas sp.]|nr:hypothetical protein [Polaromonas sp.]MDP3798671.1 hypothetical protein [Polaromonas sp.]
MATRRTAACQQPALAQPADLLGTDAEEWRRLIKTLGFPAGP